MGCGEELAAWRKTAQVQRYREIGVISLGFCYRLTGCFLCRAIAIGGIVDVLFPPAAGEGLRFHQSVSSANA